MKIEKRKKICCISDISLCLIEYLEKNNKLEKIIAANKRFSTLLQGYSKYILDLYSLKKVLGYVRKGKKKEQQKKQGQPTVKQN